MKITISVDSVGKLLDIVKNCPIHISHIDSDAQPRYPTANIEQKDNVNEEKRYDFVFTPELTELCCLATAYSLARIKAEIFSFGANEFKEIKEAIERIDKLVSFFRNYKCVNPVLFVKFTIPEICFIKRSLERFLDGDSSLRSNFMEQIKQHGLEV